MAIMVAGGLTFAVPGVMPAAHAANANLFVSAENSQFDNYMSGPQIIEVVVIDSDINDTDEAKGEPDVTVNGKILRMVQAVDGNWYAYFADRDMAQIADSTVTVATASNGTALDFGTFCTAASGTSVLGVSTADTDGIAVPVTNGNGTGLGVGSSTGGAISATCTGAGLFGNPTDLTPEVNGTQVIREAKDVVAETSTVNRGQINLADGEGVWPFIQLYQLNPTGNVVIQYNKGGGVQSTTLTFDTVDQFAELSLDRSVYPRSAQVHTTITDLWLNIDPTDEDSWTFATNTDNSTAIDTFYQVFDENGSTSATSAIGLSSVLSALMCEDNCVLQINADAQSSGTDVITLQDNGDSEISINSGSTDTNDPDQFIVTTETETLGRNSIPVTITEHGPNSGVFGTYDESDVSNIIVTSDALRGTSASIDYNETPQTILAGFDFATIDIQPVDDEWSSGEEIPVVIVDGDANKNSRADEDMDLNDPTYDLIPALSTGTPFTLGTSGSAIVIYQNNGTAVANGALGDAITPGAFNADWDGNSTDQSVTVQPFSQRAMFQTGTTVTQDCDAAACFIIIETGATLEDLQDTINDDTRSSADFNGFNYFNYDIRSLGAADDSVHVYVINNTDATIIDAVPGYDTSFGHAIEIIDNGNEQGYSELGDAIEKLFNSGDAGDQNVSLLFQFTGETLATSTTYPIVADFFSFGFTDDGVQSSERIANQIIRIEAEETGDNTSTFVGSLEYIMINQVNILDSNVYDNLTPIADDPTFIVIEDLTEEDAPRVSYND
jgi:hypothetical protein